MAADNTGTNQGVTTKAKTLMNTKGPNIDAYYGPWNSTSEFETYMSSIGTIFEYTTIAVKVSGGLKKYVYYNNSWHEEGGGATTADTVSYTPTSNHPNGSVGKALKELQDFKEENSGSKVEPVATTTVDLSTKESSGASFTYDVDTKYTYSGHDTTFYQYKDSTDTKYYGVFKVYGLDKYLMYVITNMTTFTYEGTCTETLLPADAKKEFELGTLATVKRVNGEGESWKNGTVNLFCTKQNMALRNRCKNVNFNGSTAWRVLIKSEDGNTIFVYKAKSNGNYEWEINVPRSSTANFNLLDKYFDRPEASSVSFDDSLTQLGTQEDPVTDVQTAINQLATGVSGLTGKLKVCLKYANASPIVNKEVSITVNYRGSAYDISSQYSPDTEGFKTDSNGYVINANSNEYIVLPLGAVYTIHLYDISDSYITPEDVNGIIDKNTETVNCIYENVSDVEFVQYFVQMPNSNPSVVTPENKILYIDFYNPTYPTVHSLKYKCILHANGGVKQVLDATDGDKQAYYNGEALISSDGKVSVPIPVGTKYLSYLQLWDDSLTENEQRYVKSSDIIYTASKAKRTIRFTYLDNQVGIFLAVSDSTAVKGYRECLVTQIDVTNSKIKFKDNNASYEAYINNNVLYKKLENDVASEVWEEPIIGYGIRTSQTINNSNDDTETASEYPNCSFIVPKTPTTIASPLASTDTTITIPINFGGLFQSKCYNELSGGVSSPAINKLLNEGQYAITLTTPNGNKTIKGFGISYDQMLTLKGVLSQLNSISNILFATNWAFTTNVQPVSLAQGGATRVATGNEIFNMTYALESGNPKAYATSSNLIKLPVIYPF